MLRYTPWLVALLALFIWRNGQLTLNTLSLPAYPPAYYSGGDAARQCTVIKQDDMRFCEDATFWDTLGVDGTLHRRVLLSCDPHRPGWNTVMGPMRDPDPRGALWVYDDDSDAGGGRAARPQRVALVGFPPTHDFHPLGLATWPARADGPSALFVVNHARGRTTVEQFALAGHARPEASWVRTLAHPAFVSPNAIALTSPASFYLTNDHLATRRLPGALGRVLPLVESLLVLPLGWLAHVSVRVRADGTPVLTHTFAQFGVPFANGVALSPDRKELALASTGLGTVTFYARSPASGALTKKRTVPFPFSVDNIHYDDHGDLIVAGHPHFPSLRHMVENQTHVAPSWVMSVTPRSRVEPEAGSPSSPKVFDTKAPVSASSRVSAVLSHAIETLYQSNGTMFSSSSTGLRDTRTGVLYVTGLYEDGLLVCRPL